MQQTHYEQKNGKGRAHGHRTEKGNGKNKMPICPCCHESDQVIPILYGYPTHAAFMRADRGEVYLGGCEISPFSYYCKRDDLEF